MIRTVVINVVGLTGRLLGPNTPRLRAFADAGRMIPIDPVLPAVTTTVQSTYLTGSWPAEHGIVGNGWYFRDECEIRFWRQSNRLVLRPKVWEIARSMEPGFTCANLFWWYNMYSTADVAVTPRPMYPADGRKIPDIWTRPGELRGQLQGELGQFPLFQFWGPATSIVATQWIAGAALAVDQRHRPTLMLIYLPHLDYVLQREGPAGPSVPASLREVDAVCGQLIDHYDRQGVRIIVLSEYGIMPVGQPIHINRILRQAGLIAVREELGRELLDAGASAAFAVADHQVAHVYVNDATKIHLVSKLLGAVPGVAQVLDEGGKKEYRLNHPRAGEFVLLAERGAWFTYYYWLDDTKAPDFARTVDIHRKPGYDPAELFIDPAIRWPRLKIAATLLKRRFGMRALMELTPLDAAMVRGSHGVAPACPEEGPLLITGCADLVPAEPSLAPTAVRDVILSHLFGGK